MVLIFRVDESRSALHWSQHSPSALVPVNLKRRLTMVMSLPAQRLYFHKSLSAATSLIIKHGVRNDMPLGSVLVEALSSDVIVQRWFSSITCKPASLIDVVTEFKSESCQKVREFRKFKIDEFVSKFLPCGSKNCGTRCCPTGGHDNPTIPVLRIRGDGRQSPAVRASWNSAVLNSTELVAKAEKI